MYSDVSQNAVVGPRVNAYSSHTRAEATNAQPQTGSSPTRCRSMPFIAPVVLFRTGFEFDPRPRNSPGGAPDSEGGLS